MVPTDDPGLRHRGAVPKNNPEGLFVSQKRPAAGREPGHHRASGWKGGLDEGWGV